MIVNIRGTSGSGKSTLVRALMDEHQHTDPVTVEGKVVGYESYNKTGDQLCRPLFSVGPYKTQCGGCDQIKTQDQVCDLVRDFNRRARLRQGHVVFEGLLITGNYARYKELALELGADQFVFAFLDTPFEVCCARIDARRAEKDKGPLGDHSNTRAKWDAARTVAKKYEADGLRVVWLDHRWPLPKLQELMP